MRHLKSLLCLLPLALAACESSVPPEQPTAAAPAPAAPSPPPQPAPATEPASATTTATSAATAAATAATTAPDSDKPLPPGINREIQPLPTIGVVACDSYVEAVRACLNDGHILGRERVKVRSALAKQVRAWQEEGKQPSIDACVAARSEARDQLKQYGCTL